MAAPVMTGTRLVQNTEPVFSYTISLNPCFTLDYQGTISIQWYRSFSGPSVSVASTRYLQEASDIIMLYATFCNTFCYLEIDVNKFDIYNLLCIFLKLYKQQEN